MKKGQTIVKIEAGSIAEELGIAAGDRLLAVNGSPVADVFDYRYLMNDEYVELLLKTPDGEEYLAEIDKDYDEDVGILFDEGLMDEAKSCHNKCIFCFIDQLPKGMRPTLYFKDDDTRLSFLQGNYVTLTNMKEKDIDRIVQYHLSPINISVHTTDMELRKKMLHNRHADKVLDYMKRLAAAHISMNLQIVLCKGINDGTVLDQSIADLSAFIPAAVSMSVVPIGLTKYREGLYPMEPFNREDARRVIAQVEGWQKKLKAEKGTRFVFAADEFYLKAELPIPPYEAYEDFYQIENGVGMLALLEAEFTEYLSTLPPDKARRRKVSIATGMAAYGHLRELTARLKEKFPGVTVSVYFIRNDFFGENITVSGLLTGRDIVAQLRDKDLGEALLLPSNLLRSGEDVLLDDMTLRDLERALQVPVYTTGNTGAGLIHSILEGGGPS